MMHADFFVPVQSGLYVPDEQRKDRMVYLRWYAECNLEQIRIVVPRKTLAFAQCLIEYFVHPLSRTFHEACLGHDVGEQAITGGAVYGQDIILGYAERKSTVTIDRKLILRLFDDDLTGLRVVTMRYRVIQ